MSSNTDLIREQNDQFRRQVPTIGTIPGQVLLTQGVQALADTEEEPFKHMHELFEIIRNYVDFSEDSDPDFEHDFGAFDFQGHKCFWKFDYYTKDLMHGAEDPTNLADCMRVFTIMLASEY